MQGKNVKRKSTGGMLGILKRVRDITMATINEVLDQIEVPVTMLNQFLRDIEEELSNAQTAVAYQIAAEQRWSRLVEEMEHRIAKRTRQAQLAVNAGDDTIARRAFADKQICEAKIEEYRAQYEAVKNQTGVLRQQLQELKDKYEEMRNKKLLIPNVLNRIPIPIRIIMMPNKYVNTRGFFTISHLPV